MAAKTIVLKSKRDRIFSPSQYKDKSLADTVESLRQQGFRVAFVEKNNNDYTYEMVK